MRSILTVIGSFVFGLFCEFFIRIVIIFYHQSEWVFSGISGLPGISWIAIFGVGVFTATWISGMLTVTITDFSPKVHLSALFSFYLLWRISEYFGMQIPSLGYSIGILFIQFCALFLALFIKIKSNVQTTDS